VNLVAVGRVGTNQVGVDQAGTGLVEETQAVEEVRRPRAAKGLH
jgi:hypothetical protein